VTEGQIAMNLAVLALLVAVAAYGLAIHHRSTGPTSGELDQPHELITEEKHHEPDRADDSR
jgi:hypothetical protein